MIYYVVIDTNVIVSSLITQNSLSPTIKILDFVFDGLIIPLYHEKILSEYSEVLLRKKFHLDKTKVNYILNAIKLYGLEVQPHCSDEFFKDNDDKNFYEVVLEKRDDNAYLVTGNKKTFSYKTIYSNSIRNDRYY